MGSVLGDGCRALSEEVPVGYKRTEVGVIPEDWNTKAIGNFAECIAGGTPSTSVPEYWDGAIRWMSSGELNKKLVKDVVGRITERGLRESNAKVVPPRCVLVGLAGQGKTRGTVAISLVDLCTNQSIVAILPNDLFVPEYLYFNLDFRYHELRGMSTGDGGRGGLNLGIIRSINVPFPDIAEQRAIAEVLSDVDGLLAALEALIAKKRAIKQAAMQQLLTGETRLPGCGGEWKLGKLADFGVFRSGNGFPLTFQGHQSGDYPFFKVSDINNKGNELLLKGANHWISEDVRRTLGATIFPAGSVIFAKIGAAIFLERKRLLSQESCLDNNMMAFILTASDVCEQFFYYLFLPIELGKIVSITALPSLSGREIGAICVLLPPLDEQRAIASILSDMDAEIAALERRRDKARDIKHGMMQELLTGRVRLVQPKATTEKSEGARLAEKKHNWQFNEAVVVSVLTRHFGKEQYPLGRMRYTKFSYLLHRHGKGYAEGYLKKAAGPYNPKTRYRGPEKIALKKDYVRQHRSGKRQGFVASTNIDEAERYFEKWYGSEVLQWLEQFRYKTNDDLELLTTVDMAAEELRGAGEEISVGRVKEIIYSNPEWRPKLTRPIFSDANIARAIENCQRLFDFDGKRTAP